MGSVREAAGSRGYTAIVFDFRNAGGSQSVPWTATRRLGGDVAAAARAARAGGRDEGLPRRRLTRRFGGHLRGRERPPAGGGRGQRLGLCRPADALVAAKRLRVPVLYLAAKGDRDFAADVPGLAAATRSPHEAVVLPGYEHGVQLVAASARARTLIETFLRTH